MATAYALFLRMKIGIIINVYFSTMLLAIKSGLAKHHKYSMAGVRQGNHLMLRSHDCDSEECKNFLVSAEHFELLEMGSKHDLLKKEHTISLGSQSKNQWVLFVKKDPGCKKDLSSENKKLISLLSNAYEMVGQGLSRNDIKRWRPWRSLRR